MIMIMIMIMNPWLTGLTKVVTQSWRQIKLPNSSSRLSNSISSFSTKSGPVKIGIPEFVGAIGKIYSRHRAKKKKCRINKRESKPGRRVRPIGNIEQHVQRLESKFGDIHKLVHETSSSQLKEHNIKLKELQIPPQYRKLILWYANKYRLGLWRPRS